ncbi:hypothetical protein [Streptomyces spinosirectus]
MGSRPSRRGGRDGDRGGAGPGAASGLPVLLEKEAVEQEQLGRTENHRGAVRAILEGRPPALTGN